MTDLVERLYAAGHNDLMAEAADEIERIRNENAELIGWLASVKADLWWLVGGGEFSHWFEKSGVMLPVAALKEWEEARRHFPELVAEDAQMDKAEHDDLSVAGEAADYIEFLESSWGRCRAEREEAEKDALEQARLLGMSGEREADLRGEIERLQKALSTMTAAYADAVEQHNQTLDELNKIEAAAKNLILVKGRHHAELAYKRLEESLK